MPLSDSTAGMVHDFRTAEFGNTVDQYEFAIASLLLLGTITGDDLGPIMDKFRALAGPKGYINVLAETAVNESDNVKTKLENRAMSRHIHDALDEASNSEEGDRPQRARDEA